MSTKKTNSVISEYFRFLPKTKYTRVLRTRTYEVSIKRTIPRAMRVADCREGKVTKRFSV